ncbi:alpha/beta fold hydrolase [Sphingomonas sp. SUN039]|nr:alpha/beta fold hydrolase [Sphingomonas sp. SUN039]UVO55267.1 alpha/beta fold hydrolase [Sphingomonas sp. SUN039]
MNPVWNAKDEESPMADNPAPIAETTGASAPDLKSGVRAILDGWGAILKPVAEANRDKVDPRDKRFSAPEWDHPVFDLMRQGYAIMAETMMATIDNVPGDPDQKARMTFAMRTLVEAMSPANSPFTNPVALDRALETNGASLAAGFQHLMTDMQRGQLTHTSPTAFEVGVNIATTPGKVVHETPIYQLIQYAPTTPTVAKTPLVIFPPWINRFYILDLAPEKSFIRWAVAEGLTVFMVSWKSADASMAEVTWDDYIAAQIDAIDTIRDLLDVKSVHTIGYCVAGTTLAATLAVLAAKGKAKKVKSATFFTAQVDFSEAGELLNFVDDANIAMIEQLSSGGFLDGRYLALTFNLLRGKDLIWDTVIKNYLLGKDYPSFDLLHWNGDTTNLPAKWHKAYLTDLYRDNRLVVPGAISALGEGIDLTKIETPAYIQSGREDHIAPLASVWKLTEHLRGPLRFVLAGSGHIAGVVNPPSAQKYQHWIDGPMTGLDDFVAGATEVKGSWWPDWIAWIRDFGASEVAAEGARIPGEGKLAAIEDAPGRYVKAR